MIGTWEYEKVDQNSDETICLGCSLPFSQQAAACIAGRAKAFYVGVLNERVQGSLLLMWWITCGSHSGTKQN